MGGTKYNTITTLSNFPKRPVSGKTLKIILLIASAIMLIFPIIHYHWNTDSTWMIAQGREILENGLPIIDNFRILPDMKITVQGWLFYVIVALFDKLGLVGSLLFQVLNVGLSFLAGYLYLSQYRIKTEYKIFSISLLMLIVGYAVEPRAESVTLVLLIFECIAFERYKKTRNWKWLLILPFGMILETNLHCSMVWVHFLIALAYIVPSVCRKVYLTYNKSWKLPVLFSTLMIPCMFLNPYGLDGVLYLPKSFLADTFDYVDIIELSFNVLTVVIILAMVVGISIPTFFRRHYRPYSCQFYLVIGFFILIFFAYRNVMFMYPALLTILAPFLRHLTIHDITPKIYQSILLSFIGVFFSIDLVLYLPIAFQDDFSNMPETIARELNYSLELANAETYMEKYDDKSSLNLFAGLSYGGYFEYFDFQNVYMDARPENRMAIMNGQRDELIEYHDYCVELDADDNDIYNWIQDYDFDYIVIRKETEGGLYQYMSTVDTDFVTIIDTDEIAFYRRIGVLIPYAD